MLDVLLVRIQPTDVLDHQRPKDFGFFSEEKPLEFDVSVSNGDSLKFKASKKYYRGSDFFYERGKEIGEELNISNGSYVVAIDKYPISQFRHGAKTVEYQDSEICRHEVECNSSLTYDLVILLVPDSEPIILSNLNFACCRPKGYCSSFIAFDKEDVLSMKSPFGEVIGIALQHQNKSALRPNRSNLSYTISFAKVSLPAVILQKLLETKPQPESEPQEGTNE